MRQTLPPDMLPVQQKINGAKGVVKLVLAVDSVWIIDVVGHTHTLLHEFEYGHLIDWYECFLLFF